MKDPGSSVLEGTGLTAAVVGAGSAGRRVRDVLSDIAPKARVTMHSQRAILGTLEERSRALQDFEEFSPDIVVLAGPATTRLQTILALDARPQAFFIEKPLADSLTTALQVVESLGSRAFQSQLGYNLRFLESLVFFRKLIRDFHFGRVLSVQAETGQYLPDWRPSEDYRVSVSGRRDLGGGVLLELSHEIDYLRWIFGPFEWFSAWSGKTSTLHIDVEDTALITMGFEPGEGHSPVVGRLGLDFVRRDRTRTITAVCESGSLRWDGIRGCVESFGSRSSSWEVVMVDSGLESTYHLQWRSFLQSLRDNQPPLVPLGDGVAVLEAVEAIRLSVNRSGTRVYCRELEGGR